MLKKLMQYGFDKQQSKKLITEKRLNTVNGIYTLEKNILTLTSRGNVLNKITL